MCAVLLSMICPGPTNAVGSGRPQVPRPGACHFSAPTSFFEGLRLLMTVARVMCTPCDLVARAIPCTPVALHCIPIAWCYCPLHCFGGGVDAEVEGDGVAQWSGLWKEWRGNVFMQVYDNGPDASHLGALREELMQQWHETLRNCYVSLALHVALWYTSLKSRHSVTVRSPVTLSGIPVALCHTLASLSTPPS